MTTPILNILPLTSWAEDYRISMLQLNEKRGKSSLIAYHKEKLGKQSRTRINSDGNRVWIWETGSYTVFVSKRGIEFEVPEMATPHLAKRAWEIYKQQMCLYDLEIPFG